MSEPTSRLSRRHALRLVASASLATIPALKLQEASAGRQWCRTDPVVKIAGQTAHVYVSAFVKSPKQARALATGPTKIVVKLPKHTPARHVASDHGFGYGYDFSFEETDEELATNGTHGPQGTIPVRVEVMVPMKRGDVPIAAHFVPTRPGRLARGEGKGLSKDVVGFDAPKKDA